MPIQKLTNGFIAFDFDDGPAVGVVRAAPKILQGGAKEMARSMTYRFGILNMTVGGASAGINAPADNRDAAIAEFVGDASELVTSGRVMLDAAKGLSPDELAPLRAVDSRHDIRYSDIDGLTFGDHLTGVSATAAAAQAVGGLSGKRVLIEGTGHAVAATARAVAAHGATIVGVATSKGAVAQPGGFDAALISTSSLELGDGFVEQLDGESGWAGSIFSQDADVLFVGSKMGVIDHTVAEKLQVAAVVPIDAVPYTTKATIVAQRQGTLVLPDFVSTAGPTFADWPTGEAERGAIESAVTDAVTEIVKNITGTERGPVLEACFWAESFISSWRDKAPFGRPFAA